MDRREFLSSVAAGSIAGLAANHAIAQDRKNLEVEAAVERGLEYLKKIQAPDGHWEAQGGQYPTTMTALGGMAMLMEGSTIREGKYSDQIQKAVNWFLAPARQQPNGLLGNVNNPTESQRYMYGHGFGIMFLASIYGEEEDNDQRKKLEAVITRGVQFTAKAQTSKKHPLPEGKQVDIGGWGYVSAADSGGAGGFDEGSCTVPQIQAMRAARNAGIKVPKEAIDKADAYLDACTTTDGGIVYNYTGGVAGPGAGRPPLTAAALACGLGTGQFTQAIKIMTGPNPPKGNARPSIVRWFEFCKKHIPVAKGRVAHDEYQSYYYAQAMYALGDDRYEKLFPGEPKETHLTWSKYKEAMVPYLLESQDKAGGGWTSGYIGPVFSTSINLTILQLDKGLLQIYKR
jgi:hypothetical protein